MSITTGAVSEYTPAAMGLTADLRARASAARRVVSIDIVRGVVMVLMAIDHVRVFSGQPAGGPTPGIFFTRWITHFVAPAFVFLAGTSAYLYGQRVGDRKKLAQFLLTRGLWLVLLELTVVRVGWTFNFDFAHYLLAGVIWMIGCIADSAIVSASAAIAGGCVAILLGHNLAICFPRCLPRFGRERGGALEDSLPGGGVKLGEWAAACHPFVIVPWIGVMAAGYFRPGDASVTERRSTACVSVSDRRVRVAAQPGRVWRSPRPWRQCRPAIRVPIDVGSPGNARATNPRAASADAKTARLPEHTKYQRRFVSADDAWANVCVAGACRYSERAGGTRARDVWASAVLLLSPAHPADSPRGVRRVADSRGFSESVVVCQSPDDESPRAGGIHVEFAVAVSRVGNRGGGVVCTVPVVCSRSRWE